MKRLTATFATFAFLTASAAYASDASTSATAGYNRYSGGNAGATASYTGDKGYARTDTRTGNVNIARGVAVGADRDGLSISVSNAIAPKNGPAIATNFNMSINRDGGNSVSFGLSAANGGRDKQVATSGSTYASRHRTGAASIATGKTSGHGRVIAVTHSRDYRATRSAHLRTSRAVIRGYRR